MPSKHTQISTRGCRIQERKAALADQIAEVCLRDLMDNYDQPLIGYAHIVRLAQKIKEEKGE